MKNNTYSTNLVGESIIDCEGYHSGMSVTVLTDNRGDIIMYLGNSKTVRTDVNGASKLIDLLECAVQDATRRNGLLFEDEQVVSSSETDTRQKQSSRSETQRVDVYEMENLSNDPIKW